MSCCRSPLSSLSKDKRAVALYKKTGWELTRSDKIRCPDICLSVWSVFLSLSFFPFVRSLVSAYACKLSKYLCLLLRTVLRNYSHISSCSPPVVFSHWASDTCSSLMNQVYTPLSSIHLKGSQEAPVQTRLEN